MSSSLSLQSLTSRAVQRGSFSSSRKRVRHDDMCATRCASRPFCSAARASTSVSRRLRGASNSTRPATLQSVAGPCVSTSKSGCHCSQGECHQLSDCCASSSVQRIPSEQTPPFGSVILPCRNPVSTLPSVRPFPIVSLGSLYSSRGSVCCSVGGRRWPLVWQESGAT